MTLKKEHPEVNLNIFLMADAVGCAVSGQNTPQGYYSIERMLKSVIGKGVAVKLCGTCVDARGIRNVQFIEVVGIGNMSELARWSVEADKVFTF